MDNNILDKLLDASHKPSYECSQLITDILYKELPIKGCSFYSFYEETKLLTLRAQSGFNYQDYESFELDLDKLAGLAIKHDTIIKKKDIRKNNSYRDKSLIKKYNLKEFIAFPLKSKECIGFNSLSICQKNIGVICIYLYSTIEDSMVSDLSFLLGKVYSYSIIADRLLVRSDIVNTSLTSKDLNSFLHKLLRLLSDKWRLEASTVFIYDDRNETLIMRGTTGVISDLKLIERIYNKDETKHLTVQAYLNKKTITITEPDMQLPYGKYPEIVNSIKKSEIYIPITEPVDKDGNKEITGVFRTINHIVNKKNVNEVCCHGWEDVSLALFVAEVIGIISHIFRRNDAISLNFERAMHGINRPIMAVKTRLKDIYRYVEKNNLFQYPYNYYLKFHRF